MRDGKAASAPLVVRALSHNSHPGWVLMGNRWFPCALGRSGRTAQKREGDGATPFGAWTMTAILYRRDRVQRPRSGVPVSAIEANDGWCDAPADRNYNRAVQLPYAASCEQLWREDHVYDLVVVLSHNACPRRRNGGSAIFMHLARPGYLPTEGCIALSARDLRQVLKRCRLRASVRVVG